MGLALTALVAASSRADDPTIQGRVSIPAAPTVAFSTAPIWEIVPGTHVSVIRADQRPTYDMFSYDNSYYVYNNGYWYRSAQLNGPYVALDVNTVPVEFRTVPRERWISYPADWSTSSATATATATVSTWTPSVSFKTEPRWVVIPGTTVYQVRTSERPRYDLFRYGSDYYVYQNGNWYLASSMSGPYAAITVDRVPTEFRSIRQTYWRSYPKGWTYLKVKKAKKHD